MFGVKRGVPYALSSGQNENAFTFGRESKKRASGYSPYDVPSTPQGSPARQPLTSTRIGASVVNAGHARTVASLG